MKRGSNPRPGFGVPLSARRVSVNRTAATINKQNIGQEQRKDDEEQYVEEKPEDDRTNRAGSGRSLLRVSRSRRLSRDAYGGGHSSGCKRCGVYHRFGR